MCITAGFCVNIGVTHESGQTLLELAMRFGSYAVVDYLNSYRKFLIVSFFDRRTILLIDHKISLFSRLLNSSILCLSVMH